MVAALEPLPDGAAKPADRFALERPERLPFDFRENDREDPGGSVFHGNLTPELMREIDPCTNRICASDLCAGRIERQDPTRDATAARA
jgi:hypothetical protein